ncbi:MAG TPA: winged helix DNA-binding domain-containing protein, partial [Candidatus Limnocylindrales bacterium]
LENALYEERSLLKILGMRRTMFVVPPDLAAIIQSAVSDTIAARERARLVRMIEEAGIAKPATPWIAEVERQTIAALDRLGEATAADLTKEVEGLRAQIPFGAGKKWQSTVGVSTRMLFLLSTEGRIIRGRPKGTLVSSLYRWAPMDRWLPEPLPVLHKEEAEAELVRHYLGAYGPATTTDIQWWAGWTLGQVRRALAQIGAIEVDLDDAGRGWVLADDVETADARGGRGDPWVALLPALDATIMGWQQRDWFLAPHAPRLFDRNGNAGPTIWVDGRVVGGWAQRRSGEIRWELLEDAGAEARASIGAKAAALGEWLGPLRFLPRFRTPLEQELVA